MRNRIDELRRAREELRTSARELEQRCGRIAARVSALTAADASAAPSRDPAPTRDPAPARHPSRPERTTTAPRRVIATLLLPERRSVPVGRRASARTSSTAA